MQLKIPEFKFTSNFKFKELFKEKRFLILAGALLFVAVAGGILGIVLLSNRDSSGNDLTGSGPGGDLEAADEAIVLPQQVRSEDEDSDNSFQLFRSGADPFASPMRLTGIATGGRGGATAIIESGGYSFVVFEGDYVEDYWAVRLITGDMVVLRAGDQEVFLYFDQAPVTRTIEPLGPATEEDEDDPEEGA